MDEVDEMVVAVGADTDGFRREIAEMRDELAGPLVSAADAAGRGIERALSRAVLSGKLGFEDLKRLALSVMNEIARSAISGGLGALVGGGGLALSLLGAPGRATGGPVRDRTSTRLNSSH